MMGGSNQQLARMIESRLELIDVGDVEKRETIYNSARKAMRQILLPDALGNAEVSPDPANSMQLKQLESVIAEIESNYRLREQQDHFQASRVAEQPASVDAIEIDETKVFNPPSSQQNWGHLRDWAQTANKRGRLIIAGMALLAALVLVVLLVQFDSENSPIPELFANQKNGYAISIFGNPEDGQLSAYGELTVTNRRATNQSSATIVSSASTGAENEISKFSFTPMDPAYAKLVSGRKISIGIIARADQVSKETPKFAVKFHSAQLPLEGKFQTLSDEFATYYFEQEIPKSDGKENSEMIIVIPQNSQNGSKIEIREIKFLVLSQKSAP